MGAISCVMPLYNCSRYMDKCITSLLNQTFTDFELIIVEDCSTDDSLVKCKQYAEKDSRIRVIHNNENKGAAVSRNIGLTYATGEYIIFLDSDDYYHSEMFEKYYNKAIENNVELVVGGFDHYWLDKDDISIKKDLWECIPSNGKVYNKHLTVENINIGSGSPCNKFVKRDLLIKNNINFPNVRVEEDVFYSYMVSIHAESIYYYNEILATVITNIHGLSCTYTKKESYIYVVYLKILKYICETHKMSDKFIWDFINLTFKNMISLNSVKEYSNEYKNTIINDFFEFIAYMEEYFQGNIKLNESNMKFYMDIKKCKNNVLNINFFSYSAPQKIKSIQQTGDKVALWGCGVYGKLLIDALNNNNIKIDGIIDNDTAKQGTIYCDYKISSYEEICNKIDTVLVTNMRYYDSICKQAKDKKVIYIE